MNLNALLLALALTLLTPQAGADDLWTLLGNSGDTVLPGGEVVYVLHGSEHVSLNVGVTLGMLKGEGYTSLTAVAFKFTGTMTAPELRLFARQLLKLSTSCFNIDPARGPVIEAWVLSNDAQEQNVYYTAGTRPAEKDFGPLHMRLEKRSNGQGHSVAVMLSRSGTPGQAPWLKSCIASG